MTESKNSEKILRITEKMILPLAVAAPVFIANNVANKIADDQLSLAKKTQEAAAAARQTEIELKYIDLFFRQNSVQRPKSPKCCPEPIIFHQ